MNKHKMKKAILFIERVEVEDPIVIERKRKNAEDWLFSQKQLTGSYYLVMPRSWEEIRFLRDLEHNVEKFAPWRGTGPWQGAGVIVPKHILPQT